MNDLISRQELGAAIDNWLAIDRYYHPYSKQKTIPVSELIDIIKLLPSAQRTGRWKVSDLPKGKMKYCSECGFGQYIADERQYNFCPNCGCAMEGEQDE